MYICLFQICLSMNGLLFTNVLMYVSRAELGHLSGEGRWDKQEGTEGSYKVLVLTKMLMMNTSYYG